MHRTNKTNVMNQTYSDAKKAELNNIEAWHLRRKLGEPNTISLSKLESDAKDRLRLVALENGIEDTNPLNEERGGTLHFYTK